MTCYKEEVVMPLLSVRPIRFIPEELELIAILEKDSTEFNYQAHIKQFKKLRVFSTTRLYMENLPESRQLFAKQKNSKIMKIALCEISKP